MVSTSKNTKEPDLDAPIQYSKTAALKWRASESRTGKESNRLWYEPHVVFGSVMVFLIYFSVLREENDIDQELKRSLYSRIDGLEDAQRKQSLGFNQISRGRETSEIINQLNEVENGNKKKNV